jgi:hypothetical protein
LAHSPCSIHRPAVNEKSRQQGAPKPGAQLIALRPSWSPESLVRHIPDAYHIGKVDDHPIESITFNFLHQSTSMANLIATKPFLIAAFVAACAAAGSVHAKTGNAEPFGIVVGGHCEAGVARLGEVRKVLVAENEFDFIAQDPKAIYGPATGVTIRCLSEKVVAMTLTMQKIGIANEEARATYRALEKTYKRVAGGPVPQVGNGYARFTKGDSVIELYSPHMSFVFNVGYFEKDFYKAINDAEKKKASELRDSRNGL